ncbi:MAG: NYN domain-containing protein [Ferruginibacter sp.]
MKKAVFYIDGFNFYYGLKAMAEVTPAWKNYYWIDLVKFCSKFLPDDAELIVVHYFTSPPQNTEKRRRQMAFLNANRLINGEKFKYLNGHYSPKDVSCGICKKTFQTLEEKRTDVNIALQVIMDCYEDNVDLVYIITADSDQIPTMQLIKNKFPGKVFKVLFPPLTSSHEILQITKVHHLNDHEQKFKESMMPGEVVKDGKKYTRPPGWKS